MKVEDVTYEELQLMRLKVQKPTVLARFFEGNEDENRFYILNTTVPPTTFVSELPVETLIKLILKRGYRLAAQCLGVSASYLKKVVLHKVNVKEVLVLKKDDSDGFMEPVSEERFRGMAQRVPFLRLLEASSHWSPKKIKKNVKVICDVSSNLQSTKGRKAEEFYKEQRGTEIIRDMNLEERTPPYDFEDREYSRVDVKSSRQHSTKGDGPRWYFSLKGEDCDWFACVGWDETFEVPLFVVMVERILLVKESFVVTRDAISSVLMRFIYHRGGVFSGMRSCVDSQSDPLEGMV